MNEFAFFVLFSKCVMISCTYDVYIHMCLCYIILSHDTLIEHDNVNLNM